MLHGFPHDFKFTKGKNTGSASTVIGRTDAVFISNGCNTQQHSLTKEQYNQLVKFLGNIRVQGENTGEDAGVLADDFISGHRAVNLGPSLKSPLEIGRARSGLCFIYPKCHNCSPSCHSTFVWLPFALPNASIVQPSVCLPSTLPNASTMKPSVCLPCTLPISNKQTHTPHSTAIVKSTHSRNKKVCSSDDVNSIDSANSLCSVDSHTTYLSL